MRHCIFVLAAAMFLSIVVIPVASAYETATSFQYPLPSWDVENNGFWSCEVDCYHLGEDVGASAGTAVYAIANGVVKEAQFHNGYGGTVLIEHYTGTEYVTSIVGHLKTSTLAVSVNDEVSQGDLIGYVGTSAENGGWSEHVHLGIHKGQYSSGTSCDGYWTYAGYDYSGCTQSQWYTPTSFIESHSEPSYNIVWQEQFPTYSVGQDALYLVPNETVTCGLKVLNNSNVPLSNYGGSEWYVELHSTNSSYNQDAASSLAASGWISSTKIVTSNTTANPGQPTWYYFNITTPSTPGTYWLYMRLYRPHEGYGWVGPTGWNIKVVVVDSDPPTGCADLAAFYDYGSGTTRIHAFLSTDHSFAYQGPNGWWSSTGYTATAVKATSGDFNGDGYTDIAGFYDYPGTATRIHVWLSTGSGFTYQGSNGWWSVGSGYDTDNITNVLSGDFNHDGKDDIATVYGGSSGTTRLHVWLSTGSSFSYQGPNGWWSSTGYTATAVKATSSDFNGDGYTDIAGFYDYAGSAARIHVWLSTGSGFSYQGSNGWWSVGSGYDTDFINHVLSGDFNQNGKDDIATVYGSSNGTTRLHVWLSTGSSFSYQGPNGWWTSTGYTATAVKRAAAGDFNGDEKPDIVLAYRYSINEVHYHMFLSTGSSFTYQGPSGWWQAIGYEIDRVPNLVAGYFDGSGGAPKVLSDVESVIPTDFRLHQNYPNPFNPVTTISYALPRATHVSLDVYNILGQRVANLVDVDQEAGQYTVTWDGGKYASGIYFYKLHTEDAIETKKMLLLK